MIHILFYDTYKFEICVLGLADGRMLVSTLPLPFVRVEIAPNPHPHSHSLAAVTVLANNGNGAPFSTGINARMMMMKRQASRRVMVAGGQDVAQVCITIIDTIILNNYTNDAYTYDTWRRPRRRSIRSTRTGRRPRRRYVSYI
jgi:hypothetical protein